MSTARRGGKRDTPIVAAEDRESTKRLKHETARMP
jgi:hypothetical protein